MKLKLLLSLLLCFNLNLYATIKLYISADRTGAKESGLSIEKGVQTALSQLNNTLAEQKVEVVLLDHRGSTPRFKKHLKQFLNDDNALVMYSGLHSPPLLSQKNFINDNKIPLLVPWAAAGPITRSSSSDNYIFRLSIDDTKAGIVIVNHAIQKESFKKPFLLLENTGWGKSNQKTMTKALEELGIHNTKTKFFNWNIGENEAKVILNNIIQQGYDVIFFVGNAPEGKKFVKAMSEFPKEQRLAIRSHWGITGGDFPTVITKDIRQKVNLQFIQTSFSFVSSKLNTMQQTVFKKAQSLYPELNNYKQLQAPVGFIHAYDLTLLLNQAIQQITWSDNMHSNRVQLKTALENINTPIKGLIKTYEKPFSVFSKDNPDAHEALNIDDFIMGQYGEDNEILLIQ